MKNREVASLSFELSMSQSACSAAPAPTSSSGLDVADFDFFPSVGIATVVHFQAIRDGVDVHA
eukprot:3277079-Amphidinium_carterae.1